MNKPRILSAHGIPGSYRGRCPDCGQRVSSNYMDYIRALEEINELHKKCKS